MSSALLYVLAFLLALIPALCWFVFLYRKNAHGGLQGWIFVGSTFSVVPILALDTLGKIWSSFDIPALISSVLSHNSNAAILGIFIFAGMMEEIVKQGLLRWIDTRRLVIQTIGDSIHFSLVAALGFSFAENIFYLIHLLQTLQWQSLISVYVFRSIITTAGHLVFSGLFGYFYGVAKFSITIDPSTTWEPGHKPFLTFLSRFLGISRFQTYKELTIIKGLLLALLLHALFNFLLQSNWIFAGLILIVGGFIGLQYLLKRKSSQLVLVNDIATERVSTMAKKDEDVVLELLTLWFKEKRYVDVLHICQRLQERDPGNPVVELFRARALDKMDQQSVYYGILSKLFPGVKGLIKKKRSLEEMGRK